MRKISLFEIISSESRMRTLKVLSDYDSCLSLRQIEAFSGLAIRSVQVAIQSLVKENVVRVVRNNKKSFYQFNHRNQFASALKKIFEVVEQEIILHRSSTYQKKARYTLQFCSELIELMRKAE